MESLEDSIHNYLIQAIKDRVFPGAVVGVTTKEKVVAFVHAGHQTYDHDSPLITNDSIFDLASLTKSIVTASLIFKLVEDHTLSLDDLVITYLPELQNDYREQITIRQLMNFTIAFHLEKLTAHQHCSPEELITMALHAPLLFKPGEKYLYTDAPYIVLGMIIQKVSGVEIDVLSNELFFKPLQMTSTTFHPEQFADNLVVPTEVDEWRGRLIHKEVHDEKAWILSKSFAVGSAGLFSSTDDLMIFARMLLNEGELNGKQYLQKETVQQMHTNQFTGLGEMMIGLGWSLHQPTYMGKYCTEQTFGRTGFTGTMFLCDIRKDIGLVFLNNAVHPKRKSDRTIIHKARADIADIVLSHF